MSSLRPRTLALLAAVLLPQGFSPVFAQAPLFQVSGAQNASAANAEALGEVRLVADRIFAMKSDATRVRGLAAVGRAACPFDKEFARETFLRAQEIVLAADDKNVRTLRRALLPQVARCDAELALRLNRRPAREGEEHSNDSLDPEADLDAARSVIREDAGLASTFLQRSAQAPLTDQQLQSAMMLMMELRVKDAAAADAIFLSVLARLRGELRAEANRVLLVGNYLFTSPMALRLGATRSDLNPGAGITFGTIGAGRENYVPTYNLMADRPGMNAELVRPYLETAIDIFSRPVQDLRLQLHDYVALHQLLPKVARFAPELAGQFAFLRERLSPNIPEYFRQPAAYASLEGSATAMPSLHDRIAAEPNATKRDGMRVRAVAGAWTQADLNEARVWAAQVEDQALRERVLLLVEFFDAGKSIERGNIEEAEERVRNMTPSVRRALLSLGLAAALVEKGERDAAAGWWKTALKDAESADHLARANVLLSVTAVGMRIERSAALASLERAVREFNAAEKKDEPSPAQRPEDQTSPWNARAPAREPLAAPAIVRAYGGGFVEELVAGDFPAQFRLAVKGVAVWDFTPPLFAQVGSEVDQAQAIVLNLASESHRANALASLVRPIFENAAPRTQRATRPDQWR